MTQYTFKMDDPNLPYKKLITLPSAYYLIKKDSSQYTIDSSGSKGIVQKTDNLKLKWEDNQIVLFDGDKALESSAGSNIIINQDDILGKDKDDIIKHLESGRDAKVVLNNINALNNDVFGIGLSAYHSGNTLSGSLNFINFKDIKDLVLQKVIKDNGEVYFTVAENSMVCISDKDAKCTPMYVKDTQSFPYEYKLISNGLLEAADIFAIIERSNEANGCNALQDRSVDVNKLVVKITKGAEITGGKYEANIELEGSIIGAFSPTGYYFYDDIIYIYNHFAQNKESTSLPQKFHFLQVATDEDSYKLTLCNKYGHKYHNIPNDYEFIDATHIKSSKNVNLAHYSSKNGSKPSFIIKANDNNYPNSQQQGIDVYEIAGKKIGSLINEFGYYDGQDKFHYVNQRENKMYDSPSFTITKGDNRCKSNIMKEGNGVINEDHTNTTDCSLTEYVANYVNFIASTDQDLM